MKIIKIIMYWLDVIVPRFITEEVALVWNVDHYDILCPLHMVGDEEHYDATCKLFSLNFFGRAYFVKQVGEVKDKK